MDGWVGIGWDLCAGLLYEHRFTMLIIYTYIIYTEADILNRNIKIRDEARRSKLMALSCYQFFLSFGDIYARAERTYKPAINEFLATH